jgi:hypothetical protein
VKKNKPLTKSVQLNRTIFAALRLVLRLPGVGASNRRLREYVSDRVGIPIGQTGADNVRAGRAQQRFGNRIRNAERSHASGAARLDARRRVFDDQTFAGNQR